MCRAPGRARDMDRSSPKTLCHFLIDTLRCVTGMLIRISARRSCRCGGRDMVIATVSTIHPNTFRTVDHEQSPFISFFNDTGSRRVTSSSASKGRKIESIACIKMDRTRRWSFFPWQRPIKSSTKISTYCSFFRVDGRAGSRCSGRAAFSSAWLGDAEGVSVGSGLTGAATEAARSSRRCG